MNRTALIWTIVFVLGAAGLVVSAIRGAGASYVYEVTTEYRGYEPTAAPQNQEQDQPQDEEEDDAEERKEQWKPIVESEAALDAEMAAQNMVAIGVPNVEVTVSQPADPIQQDLPGVRFSWWRTIGVWVAGLLTLCVLSFLVGDNVFYRTAEALVIGTSAAYVMVAAFWPNIVEKLLGSLVPALVRAWAYPGLQTDFTWYYIFPLIMCMMLLMRLSPQGGWIARWPLAFFIGATAGFRLIGHLESDFTEQIRASIVPLIVIESGGKFDFWASVTNIIMTLGVLVTLVYFFFSIEHKGVVGKTARAGIWFLMITFGAAFGLTVMGRIALIAERFQFLVDDWLWIIDPTGRRAALIMFGL